MVICTTVSSLLIYFTINTPTPCNRNKIQVDSFLLRFTGHEEHAETVSNSLEAVQSPSGLLEIKQSYLIVSGTLNSGSSV